MSRFVGDFTVILNSSTLRMSCHKAVADLQNPHDSLVLFEAFLGDPSLGVFDRIAGYQLQEGGLIRIKSGQVKF